MAVFLYKLQLTERLHEESHWTDADKHHVGEHFAYLQEALNKGKLIIAGRTDEANDKTFGIAVFRAENEKEAEHFVNNDPAVKNGVMLATLHPYKIALLQK